MAETTILSWSAVLDQIEAALAEALRDAEARARRWEARTEVPIRLELQTIAERLQSLPLPVSQAEQADAALAAAEDEVRQWRAQAAASRRKLAEQAGHEV